MQKMTSATDDSEAVAARRAEKLHAIGLSLAAKRADAIAAREQSGIEREWTEDEEHYQGIDDANRGEHSAWRSKPPGQVQAQAAGGTRSTVFVNITRPYVDAASARISDMLLPTDDRAWAIQPTPIPDLANIAAGKIPPDMRRQVEGMFAGQAPAPAAPPPEIPAGMVATGAQPVAPPTGSPPAAATPPGTAEQYLDEAVQAAKKLMADATQAAEAAQKRIEDWHVECQFHAETRKAIEDAARLGCAVLKGPVPVKKKQVAYLDNAIAIREAIQPATVRIDPWNLFPDGACGENIHAGSYVWERAYFTPRQLRDMIGLPGYLEDQIRACLEEGPQTVTSSLQPDRYLTPAQDRRFEVWYYHGELDASDLEAAHCACPGEVGDAIPAMVTMVNNRVIRASLNPLDSGEFPYDVMPWQRRSGHWAGVGVARQIRVPQRIVNAGSRAMMDNAGLASGPMLIFRQGVVTPSNGVNEMAPRKIWFLSEDADATIAAERAIGVIKIDMMVNELMAIIQFGLKLAEDVTGLPMLLQGQQGQAPDTVGGMQMMNNNASTVLRRLARMFDDYITEPHVRRYYTWILQYGEDDAEKGDFTIDARGSSALVERDIQNQAILQMGALVANPSFGINPEKWFEEYCKSQRLDPKRLRYTDEEKAKLASQPQQPPLPVAVAQLKAQVELQVAQLEAQTQLQRAKMQTDASVEKMRVDTDRDRALVESQLRRDQTDYEARMAELQVKLQLAQLEYASRHQISLDELKVKLASDTMKLRTTKELAALNASAKDLPRPPVEPPGRAIDGSSFTQ